MASKVKSEKKQHIQVFARVRPPSTQEARSPVVVECIGPKEVCVRIKGHTKTFTFDRVFGPDSKQADIYKTVVSPLISEVLQGYNCTVFAYGQTGTGKTFTMIGDRSPDLEKSWEDDPSCGIIPRMLSHLFDELKIRAEEFTVRVSFLELYNEELYDLLAPNVNDDNKNLRLYEDSVKKGSVIVSGLEERTIQDKDDVYAILEAGNLRRQTAPTLMNVQSSRSHTIFTITVHIEFSTSDGEDLVKIGKLNLVDLAGSENIGRSGAVDIRAREAGNINQSLLTLGRVITSLVERTPHVPYRESKLTRILQDSLGGRTKTSIIATVSPTLSNIEETLSTFDYAHRARNITNKPEINQKTTKRVLLKEYTEEIERLRRDLIATREKHGVYLAPENYNEIMAEKEYLNKEYIAKLNLLKAREEELTKQGEVLKNLNVDLSATQDELEQVRNELQETKKTCIEREEMLNELSQQTNEILKVVDGAVADTRGLHDRLDRSRRIQEHNINSGEKFKTKYCINLNDMKNRTKEFLSNGLNEVQSQIEMNRQFLNNYIEKSKALREETSILKNEIGKQFHSMMNLFLNQKCSTQKFLSDMFECLKGSVNSQNDEVKNVLSNLIEYSKQTNTNWNKLRMYIINENDMLKKHWNNMLKVQQNSENILRIISELYIMLDNKEKEEKRISEYYEEKFESLATKERELLERDEMFRQRLEALSQEFADHIKIKMEYQEKFKNLRAEKVLEELNFRNCTMENFKVSFAQASDSAKENSTIIATDCATKITENVDSMVLPLLDEMSTSEVAWSRTVNNVMNQSMENNRDNVEMLFQLFGFENEKMEKFSEAIAETTSENIRELSTLTDEINNMAEFQELEIGKLMNENLSRKQKLCSGIMEHSEELFTNIHHRVKEIEIFFTEGIQKDEKTGDTPQRREFNYPRRITIQTTRNLLEHDNEGEDKENIPNFGENAER